MLSALCYVVCGFVLCFIVFAHRMGKTYSIIELFYFIDSKTGQLDWDYRFIVAHSKDAYERKLQELFSDQSKESESKILITFNNSDEKTTLNVNKSFFNLNKNVKTGKL